MKNTSHCISTRYAVAQFFCNVKKYHYLCCCNNCSSFKVYDYGFTPISRYTKGGFAADFEGMKLECLGADRKQPYLLFAREVNEGNQLTKIWVDVNLPKDGKFSCLTEMQRSLVKIRIEKAVADNLYENGSVTFAESVGIETLQKQVIKIMDCCWGNKQRGEDCLEDCGTLKEFVTLLSDKNFTSLGVYDNPPISTQTVAISDVEGETKANFQIAGENYNLDEEVTRLTLKYKEDNPTKSIKVYLKNYTNNCAGFTEMYDKFKNDNSSSKIFIISIEESLNKVNHYVLLKGLLEEDFIEPLFKAGQPDNYFDLDGNYLGKSLKAWGRVRIINKKDGTGSPPFVLSSIYKDATKKIINPEGNPIGELNSINLSAHIQFLKDQNRQDELDKMLAQTIKYYAIEIGCNLNIKISTPSTNNEKNAFAWTPWLSTEKKYIDEIHFNKVHEALTILDDYDQIMNIIYHEKLHFDSNKVPNECQHLEDIYLLQIKDPHFQNCTYGYQISLIQSTACFILACRKRVNYFPSDYPKTNADKELIRLNDLLNIQIKKIGVGVYFENIMGDLVVKINTKKGVLNGKCDKNYQN